MPTSMPHARKSGQVQVRASQRIVISNFGDLRWGMSGRLDSAVALADAVRDALRHAVGPRTRQDLRAQLRVNNERLGHILADLEARRLIERSGQGWSLLVQLAAPGAQQPLAFVPS